MWAHQKRAVELSETMPDIALFYGLGTGKTRTTIEIIRAKFNKHQTYLKTLVICPSVVISNWRNEILKFSQIEKSKIFLLDDKLSLTARADAYLKGPPGVYITNFEAFAFESFSKALHTQPPQILVIDESHKIKTYDAARTKSIVRLSMLMEPLPIKYRFILTGSPVTNDYLDIFSQFQALDAGKTFGTNFFAFRAQYFTPHVRKLNAQRQFTEWVPKKDIAVGIKALMEQKSLVAKKELVLDLPPLLRVEVDVTMSAEQAKAYKQMKNDFIAFVEADGVGVAQIALTKALRMQQILSGFLKLDTGEIHFFKDNPRAKALSDLLEDMVRSEKVIVWSVFHDDYETIRSVCKKLKIEFAEVTGLTKDKEAELKRFDTDPNCRVMIASQAAAGTGTNMTEASAMIYYSKNFNFEHDFQSESRNYRGGSERHKKITRYDLVCRGTIDELVLGALRDKKDLSTNILALKDLLSTL